MYPKFRLAYMAHSVRSDWNNGNAHFLRGLLRAMVSLGHDVTVFEPCTEWSIQHLHEEEGGQQSLDKFTATYPELHISTYCSTKIGDTSFWRAALRGFDMVILHEWNPPQLAAVLLEVRDTENYRLLFHDTHHRASSSPEQIRAFGVDQFDAVLAFGASLRERYRYSFGIPRVWTLHEAADTTVFRPQPCVSKKRDVVWIGNWGDDERNGEICEFLLRPAAALPHRSFTIFGVRYPEAGLNALKRAGIQYDGYLPNLGAPSAYAGSRLTLHIPRQQYTTVMTGIPTIRVFEALACGIPLISAPWQDTEQLFREGDFLTVRNGKEMQDAIERLLSDKKAAITLALHGLETILSRHTCKHRAEELTSICEELLH